MAQIIGDIVGRGAKPCCKADFGMPARRDWRPWTFHYREPGARGSRLNGQMGEWCENPCFIDDVSRFDPYCWQDRNDRVAPACDPPAPDLLDQRHIKPRFYETRRGEDQPCKLVGLIGLRGGGGQAQMLGEIGRRDGLRGWRDDAGKLAHSSSFLLRCRMKNRCPLFLASLRHHRSEGSRLVGENSPRRGGRKGARDGGVRVGERGCEAQAMRGVAVQRSRSDTLRENKPQGVHRTKAR